MLHSNTPQYYYYYFYYILSHHNLISQLSLSLSLSACHHSLFLFLSLLSPSLPPPLSHTAHPQKETITRCFSGWMEYYMDEKWKLSKEDKPHSSSKPPISRSVSQRASSKSSLQKSFSSKNPFNLSRSTSQKSGTSSKSSLQRSSSTRGNDFTRKCSNMAKEQKAKFYIVKRCISMLVNWKKNGDS